MTAWRPPAPGQSPGWPSKACSTPAGNWCTPPTARRRRSPPWRAAAPAWSAEPNRLNTAFILADDLGYADVASYGSKFYETPNIDRLVA